MAWNDGFSEWLAGNRGLPSSKPFEFGSDHEQGKSDARNNSFGVVGRGGHPLAPLLALAIMIGSFAAFVEKDNIRQWFLDQKFKALWNKDTFVITRPDNLPRTHQTAEVTGNGETFHPYVRELPFSSNSLERFNEDVKRHATLYVSRRGSPISASENVNVKWCDSDTGYCEIELKIDTYNVSGLAEKSRLRISSVHIPDPAASLTRQ